MSLYWGIPHQLHYLTLPSRGQLPKKCQPGNAKMTHYIPAGSFEQGIFELYESKSLKALIVGFIKFMR